MAEVLSGTTVHPAFMVPVRETPSTMPIGRERKKVWISCSRFAEDVLHDPLFQMQPLAGADVLHYLSIWTK